MKTSYISKNLVVTLALSLVLGTWSSAQEEAGGYLFFGSSVSAESGKSHFPIVGVDKKNIFVDAGIDVKKVSMRAPCRVRSELILSERFADVLEIKFNTSSMANTQRASQAVSDMHYADFQSEVEIARLQGGMENPNADTLSASDQQIMDKVESVRQDNSDFQASMQDGLDMGTFEADELVDTVHVRGTLIPAVDLPGAYCVVVITHDYQDLETGEIEGRGRFARAKYIGDLLQDEIVEIRVRVSTGEFNKESAEYELHLFTENGEQVALSNSRGLKPLTPQEVATFKELSAKTSLRNRS